MRRYHVWFTTTPDADYSEYREISARDDDDVTWKIEPHANYVGFPGNNSDRNIWYTFRDYHDEDARWIHGVVAHIRGGCNDL